MRQVRNAQFVDQYNLPIASATKLPANAVQRPHICGRFPYLFTSLNTYATIERFMPLGADGRKSRSGEAACIGGACLTSSAVITTVECPKVMAQLNQTPGSVTPTWFGILKEHGVGRLLRGYDATVLRESFFSCALLGSPFISRELRSRLVEPTLAAGEDGSWSHRLASAVDGRDMLTTSFCMGLLGAKHREIRKAGPVSRVSRLTRAPSPSLLSLALARSLSPISSLPPARSLSLIVPLIAPSPLAAVGFITNGPDQLKTRIQFGQFMSLPEAFAWQMREGGGVRALYGRAALFRAFYTGHGVLALNFMRHKVRALCAWSRGNTHRVDQHTRRHVHLHPRALCACSPRRRAVDGW